MATTEQLHTYLFWLRQRGQAYPLAQRAAQAPRPTEKDQEVSPAARPAPPPPPAAAPLAALREQAARCTSCPLHLGRTESGWGYGGSRPRVLFLGDGPNQEADAAGTALAGEQRALLDRMTQAMGLTLQETYVANALLCRLPDDQLPEPGAFERCRPHLAALVDLLQPELVLTMGALATRAVLGARARFHDVRGRLQPAAALNGRRVIATFHPRDLLRFPANKRLAWTDLQVAMVQLGLAKEEPS